MLFLKFLGIKKAALDVSKAAFFMLHSFILSEIEHQNKVLMINTLFPKLLCYHFLSICQAKHIDAFT